jgi:hypothetical protein
MGKNILYYMISVCCFITIVCVGTTTNSTAKAEGHKIAWGSETVWRDADRSLAGLLNSGWQIVGQSSHRAYFGGTGIRIDETTYVYTLRKESQYITCLIYSPNANGKTYSRCRHIN